jgi:hypothetical protein
MDSKNLHYYFAYGMNTNPDAMTERLSADGVARGLGAAHLQEWSFRFAVHADVVPTGRVCPVGHFVHFSKLEDPSTGL